VIIKFIHNVAAPSTPIRRSEAGQVLFLPEYDVSLAQR
jgi:hypothetical protein